MNIEEIIILVLEYLTPKNIFKLRLVTKSFTFEMFNYVQFLPPLGDVKFPGIPKFIEDYLKKHQKLLRIRFSKKKIFPINAQYVHTVQFYGFVKKTVLNPIKLEIILLDNNDELKHLRKETAMTNLNIAISNVNGINSTMKYLTNLTTLSLRQVRCGSIDEVSKLTKLVQLTFDCEIIPADSFNTLINLKKLELSSTDTMNFNWITALSKLTELKADTGRIVNIGSLKNLISLTALHLESKYLCEETTVLSVLTNLTSLYVRDCGKNITVLYTLTKLTCLNLNSNKLLDISPLTSVTNLRELELKTIAKDISVLSTLTKLRTLYLMCKNIKTFDALTTLVNLTSITLKIKNIFAFNWLHVLTELREIKLLLGPLFQDIESEKFTSLTNLSDFCIISSGHRSQKFDASTLTTKLKTLFIKNVKIANYSSISLLTNLTQLNITATETTHVDPLTTLHKLKLLTLSGNDIKDISALSTLPRLKLIHAYHTLVSDISTMGSIRVNLDILPLKLESLQDIKFMCVE